MYTGILFDMDNTLLQSNINFSEMRKSLIEFIVMQGLAQYEAFDNISTPAQVIEYGKKIEGSSASLEKELWEMVERYEAQGMQQVCLEEGVWQGIRYLKERNYRLAVVTNNTYSAACTALEQTNIASYFECIVGRDQMTALKPSPSGIVHALKQLACSPQQSVMVGDSWIDGKAASGANVDFIAYKAQEHLLSQQNVETVFTATHFDNVVQWISREREG